MFYWCNAVNLFWSMSLYEMLFQLERRRFVCSVARRTRSVNSCSVPPVDTTIMVAASTPQSPSHLRYGQAGSVLTVRCARCAGKKCFNTTLRNCIEKACLTPFFMQNLISIYWYWYCYTDNQEKTVRCWSVTHVTRVTTPSVWSRSWLPSQRMAGNAR